MIYSKKNYALFQDVIKKAYLLHLILFSSGLDADTISLKWERMFRRKPQVGEEMIRLSKQTQFLYSMVEGPLFRQMPDSWKTMSPRIAGQLLAIKKSNPDRRKTALYALISSKGKLYESERFLYLWMAFNGVYGFWAKRYVDARQMKSLQEVQEIQNVLQIHEIGNARFTARFLDDFIMEIIRRIDAEGSCFEDISREALTEPDGRYRVMADDLFGILKKNYDLCYQQEGKTLCARKEQCSRSKDRFLTPYGFLMGQFAYYFRCRLFHANAPMLLFTYKNEYELKCLTLINNLLEDFLDQEVYLLFDETYVNGVALEQLKP